MGISPGGSAASTPGAARGRVRKGLEMPLTSLEDMGSWQAETLLSLPRWPRANRTAQWLAAGRREAVEAAEAACWKRQGPCLIGQRAPRSKPRLRGCSVTRPRPHYKRALLAPSSPPPSFFFFFSFSSFFSSFSFFSLTTVITSRLVQLATTSLVLVSRSRLSSQYRSHLFPSLPSLH